MQQQQMQPENWAETYGGSAPGGTEMRPVSFRNFDQDSGMAQMIQKFMADKLRAPAQAAPVQPVPVQAPPVRQGLLGSAYKNRFM